LSPVCVIGLGAMGYGAALSLLRAGFDVHGVDLRADLRQRFAEVGGKAMSNPAEGARGCQAVLIFVVNAAQTEAVLFASDGAVGVLADGSVVVACATIAPNDAVRIAATLAKRGLFMLDAPVSGGAAKAASGEMTVMAAGDDEAFEKAGPLLNAIAARVYRLGSKPGAGSRMKLINQHLAGIHLAAAAEAVALATCAGLDLRTVHDVISHSAGTSWMFQNRVAHLVNNDSSAGSAVDIFVKDLALVLDAANSWNFPAPLGAAAHQLFKAASARGLGRENDIAIVKLYPGGESAAATRSR
jgi:putative dehydrogenase